MKMEKSYNYTQIWPNILLVLYLLSALTYCVASPSNSSSILCKNSERKALLKIKKVVKVVVDVESWVGEDCCAWCGVGCDNLTGYVIHFHGCSVIIEEDYNDEPVNLTTIITASLELKHLRYLDLSGINLLSPLSHLIGSMTQLRYLNISNNAIMGTVPPQLGNLTNLEVLDLSNNIFLTIDSLGWASTLSNLRVIDLSNSPVSQTVDLNQLPPVSHLNLARSFVDNPCAALSHFFVNNTAILSSLKYLDLTNNNLQGPVPPNLGNLSSLIFLDLSHNLINGSFPVWLTKIRSLQVLNVGFNLFSHFDGGIMGYLNNLCHLKHLDLSNNYFQGEMLQPHVNIPNCIGYELDFLDISYNKFSDIQSLTGLGKFFKLSYLDMSNNQITGTLPSFIGQLKLLKHLDLSSNQISDTFSFTALGKLIKISYLDMSNNQIRGTLPSFKGQFKLLKFLDLSSNPIQGTVSRMHIGDLSELSYLDVSYTNLSLNLPSDWLPPFQLQTFMARSCKIVNPPNWLQTQASIEELDLSNSSMFGEPTNWISNMSNLLGLNLSHNFLTGSLPQKFSSQNLQYLDLNNNDLLGTLPNWLGYLKDVDYIDLSSNLFSGSIPLALSQDRMLSTLLLNNNILEGNIPPKLAYCSNLIILNLSYNNLSGYIPPWTIGDLPELEILQLQRNQLGEVSLKGKDDDLVNETYGTIPESLCSFNNLEVLDLQKNKLSGGIPNCWQNSSSLNMINLSSNKLSGRIPCSFGQLMGTLKYLHLNDNELDGEIPSCLSTLEGLKIFDVGENNILGLIPSWLNGESFSKLNVLRLSQNILNGTIPDELCSLPLLRVIDLSNNQLAGNIPACFGNLAGINEPPKNTTEELLDISTFQYDKYEDSKSIELTHENSVNETIAGIAREYSSVLNLFTTIDLSGNHLEGTIPEELSNLSGLIALILARNHLTGHIPEKFGDMKALETLDLSGNSLSGRIPPSLGNIDSLNHINFSFNNFSGPIPTNRHFDTLDDPSAYAGNLYICGDILPKKCSNPVKQPTTPGIQDKDEVEDKNEKLWFYLVVMLGFATGFWGIIGTLWIKKSWRHVLFMHVEYFYDWMYFGVTLMMSKLKKWMKKKRSEE